MWYILKQLFISVSVKVVDFSESIKMNIFLDNISFVTVLIVKNTTPVHTVLCDILVGVRMNK